MKLFFLLTVIDTLHDKLKIIFLKSMSFIEKYGFKIPIVHKDPKIRINGLVIYFVPSSGELGTYYDIFGKKIYTADPKWIPKERDIIFDVGANIGLYTILASKYAKNCKIFSFEPNPYAFERLQRNVRENSLENIELFQMAVGKDICKQKFQLYSTFTTIGHLVKKNKNTGISIDHNIEVDVTNIDFIVQKYSIPLINILKIDVEGYEIEVLRGARESLGKIQRIVLEPHGYGDPEKEIEEFLVHNNFKKSLNYAGCIYFENLNI